MIGASHGYPLDDAYVSRGVADARLQIGSPFLWFDTVGSTNDVARDLASQGAVHGTTVFAEQQTAGRGRRGASRWRTPSGALAMSVIIRPRMSGGLDLLGRVALVTGVAVAHAVSKVALVDIGVKWPNDLVIDRQDATLRKLGGILVEPTIDADEAGGAVRHIVIGIGLNVNQPSRFLPSFGRAALDPVALIDVTGTPTSREALVSAILAELDRAVRSWASPQWVNWQRAYERILAWRNVRVVAEIGGSDALTSRVIGKIEGVSDDGALCVRDHHGDVHLVRGGAIRRLVGDPDNSTP